MKKSLADMTTAEENKAPKKSFGAFTSMKVIKHKLILNILRKHNVFFATPCYGGHVTDQFFYLCLECHKIYEAWNQF